MTPDSPPASCGNNTTSSSRRRLPRRSRATWPSTGAGRCAPTGCRWRSPSTRGTARRILFDEDLDRLGLVTEYEHPLLGRVRQFGNLITFSDTPGRQERPTPMVGQDTQEILAEMGYDNAAIGDLHDRGVVYWPDENYRWGV